jgi:hypothetical protein
MMKMKLRMKKMKTTTNDENETTTNDENETTTNDENETTMDESETTNDENETTNDENEMQSSMSAKICENVYVLATRYTVSTRTECF